MSILDKLGVPSWKPTETKGNVIGRQTRVERRTAKAVKKAAEDVEVEQAVKAAKPKRKSINLQDRWVFYRDNNFTCKYCGGQAGTPDRDGDITKLAIDHKVSLNDHGEDVPANWVCSCEKCNTAKGRKSVGMPVRTRPVREPARYDNVVEKLQELVGKKKRDG